MSGLDLELPAQLPPAISVKAFARLIETSESRVSQMCAQGMPRLSNGFIPVDEARAWIAENVRPRAPGPQETDARQAARAERERHEADLASIKLEERRGKLVSKDEVRAVAFERARFERDAHLGFAARVAATLAAELGADQGRAFAILDREMREHLTRLSDTALQEPDA